MRGCITILLTLYYLQLFAQETPTTTQEQQLEEITEALEDAELNDDSWLQESEYRARNKLNLNTATETALAELRLLTPIQIADLLRYRKLFGALISIYEMQAIPSWDMETIQKLLPYVTVKNHETIIETLNNRLKEGSHRLIARYGQTLQKAKGYKIEDSSRSSYAGNAARLMIRYKYQYKNLLQYGITASKDAGEPFFKSPNKFGFDFHSFHIFSRHNGLVKTIALGDYTVSLGQGLIHWQAMAFGKSSMIMNVKRQSEVLRAYNSAGAYYFNRGIAATLQKNKWQATVFTSLRKLDGKLNNTENGEEIISSIHVSGYHRTQTEITDKNTFKQFSYGGNISYTNSNWKASLNTVQYLFNHNIQKENKPYNLHTFASKVWSNYSIDYSYSYKNIHLFGETALDAKGNLATINSLLSSVHSKADVVLLHRYIAKAYQAINGNAFTVATTPNNETGLYAGLALKPLHAISINAYVDIYRFAWLKYRVDAPSAGKDYLLQLNYKPNKLTELYTRYRVNQRNINQNNTTNPLNEVMGYYNRSWRTQLNHSLNNYLSIRHRFELLWYETPSAATEKGFLAYVDLFYKPRGKSYNFNFRIQYFDSDSYNARLYAYENDVLYYYSVPVFYNKGSRFYINAHYNINKNIGLWLKLGHSIYDHQQTVGSGLDEIEGNKKTELRMLLSASF